MDNFGWPLKYHPGKKGAACTSRAAMTWVLEGFRLFVAWTVSKIWKIFSTERRGPYSVALYIKGSRSFGRTSDDSACKSVLHS